MMLVLAVTQKRIADNAPQLCDGTCSNDKARTSAKVMLTAGCTALYLD